MKLEIERKLNITITLPQICHFCGEEITKFGREVESLVFHSLDGDHSNWDPANKVSAHKGCHLTYHNTGRVVSEETKQKLLKSLIRACAQRNMKKQVKPLIKSGGSRVVVLPVFWLRSLERVHGSILKRMELDLNDEEIIVRPVWEDGG